MLTSESLQMRKPPSEAHPKPKPRPKPKPSKPSRPTQPPPMVRPVKKGK